MTGTYDFTINEGADWNVTLTWLTGTPPTTPVDLTGWSAHMQIRSNYADLGGTVYADLSSTEGGITLGGPAGTIVLTLSAEDTAALPFGSNTSTAVYDLKMTNPSGIISRLLQGTVTFSREVTV